MIYIYIYIDIYICFKCPEALQGNVQYESFLKISKYLNSRTYLYFTILTSVFVILLIVEKFVHVHILQKYSSFQFGQNFGSSVVKHV